MSDYCGDFTQKRQPQQHPQQEQSRPPENVGNRFFDGPRVFTMEDNVKSIVFSVKRIEEMVKRACEKMGCF